MERNKEVTQKLEALQKSNSNEHLQTFPKNNFVVTSNVDGHFERIGFDISEISQIHGTLHKFQCAGVPNTGKQVHKEDTEVLILFLELSIVF